jgi:hypothetical protein
LAFLSFAARHLRSCCLTMTSTILQQGIPYSAARNLRNCGLRSVIPGDQHMTMCSKGLCSLWQQDIPFSAET